ncbi:MAG: DUF3147 family protein [Candidatus Cloacimonadaceae bacterium]
MQAAYYILKVAISAGLIVLISELGKRSGILAGLFASIPLVSFLGIIWLYLETKDIQKISSLSLDIFWLVLPSLSFFLLFPYLLKRHVPFVWAMLSATAVMVILYLVCLALLKKYGVKNV